MGLQNHRILRRTFFIFFGERECGFKKDHDFEKEIKMDATDPWWTCPKDWEVDIANNRSVWEFSNGRNIDKTHVVVQD